MFFWTARFALVRPAPLRRHSGSSLKFIVAVVITLSLSALEAIAQTARTDVVVMINGDQFVGEIKKLEFGQLEFKASYMASSVHLDWTKISRLASKRRFRVQFDDGSLLSGSIEKLPTAPGADFEVVNVAGTTTRAFLEVVELDPLERSLWRRLRGNVGVGFTLQPEGKQTQFSASAQVTYPSEHYRVDSEFSSLFSSQEEAEDSVYDSLGVSYTRYLSRDWFWIGLSRLLKDDQLNLVIRTTGGGGVGRFVIHTNRTDLAFLSGFASTYEKYFDTASADNGTKAEALFGMRFDAFRFASSQFSTRLYWYAGLSQWGRQRVDWETSISWEIWNNVFWKPSVLENFDSRPPEGASRNSFAFTTTFGITF